MGSGKKLGMLSVGDGEIPLGDPDSATRPSLRRLIHGVPMATTVLGLLFFIALFSTMSAITGELRSLSLNLLAASLFALTFGAAWRSRLGGFLIGAGLTAVVAALVGRDLSGVSRIDNAITFSLIGLALLAPLPMLLGYAGGCWRMDRIRRNLSVMRARELGWTACVFLLCGIAYPEMAAIHEDALSRGAHSELADPLPFPEHPTGSISASYAELQKIAPPAESLGIPHWFGWSHVISPEGDMLAGNVSASDERNPLLPPSTERPAKLSHGFVWTARSGFVDVAASYPDLSHVNEVVGASHDGSTLLVRWKSPDGVGGEWLWSATEKLHDSLRKDATRWLTDPSSGNKPVQIDPHVDGSLLATCENSQTVFLQYGTDTVRWTDTDGTERIHGFTGQPTIRAVNGAGDAFAGNDDYSALVWTNRRRPARAQHLPPLTGENGSLAYGLSDDGRQVFGVSGNHLVRWNRPGSPQDLGVLPNVDTRDNTPVVEPTPYTVSDDGRDMVGWSGNVPFVWTDVAGIVPLSSVLARAGVPASDGTIVAAALSRDGKRITGFTTDARDELVRWRLTLR